MIYFLTLVVIVVILFFITVLPGNCPETTRNKFFGRNYAHRGLHTKDQSVPENSMAAFAAATEAGYGIELDIRLSKDDQVVVFHDDTLTRACAVDKRVDELTFEELKELKLFGTEESIPLLSEVLALVGKKVPLIIELKPGLSNETLCKYAYELIKQHPGDACIESFHPGIVGWFRSYAKEIFRGQLSAGAKSFVSLPKSQSFMLSNLLTNYNTRPHFIAFRAGEETAMAKFIYKLGAVSVAWTIDDTMDYAAFEGSHDAIIFQYYLPEPVFKEAEFINADKKENAPPAGDSQYLE